MFSAFILSVALLGADDRPTDATTTAKPALETYREALPRTAKTADAQVRLALWCEAHGLTAERLKHLSMAVLYDPSNTFARGLMGLVSFHGKWDRPEIVGKEIQNDPAHQAIVKEYLARRARTSETAEAQMKLAAWCEEHGLKEQAIAHYTAVTRIDLRAIPPGNTSDTRSKATVGSSPREAVAAKQEAAQPETRGQALEDRTGKVARRAGKQGRAKRAKGEQELAEVIDPLAVSMIWAIFGHGNERRNRGGADARADRWPGGFKLARGLGGL